MTNGSGAITPDTKDWTWVLERPCAECGFDAPAIRGGEVAARVLATAATWPAVLGRADVRQRPEASTWSPLEYAAHVRDVLRIGDLRLGLMLDGDDPVFENWDQDATAVADRYGSQDPAVVGEELAEAAAVLAARLDAVGGDGWQRPGRRSDGASFTVASFAVYLLHDLVHHEGDVRARPA
jgi:hypothetical protein